MRWLYNNAELSNCLARKVPTVLVCALLLSLPRGAWADDGLAPTLRPKTTIARVTESQSTTPRSHYWMLAGIAANLGATAADFATTVGSRELNPVIGNGSNGRVDLRNLALVKLGFTGAQIGLQLWIHHKAGHRYDKSFAIGDFVAAGAIGAVAAHNSSIK